MMCEGKAAVSVWGGRLFLCMEGVYAGMVERTYAGDATSPAETPTARDGSGRLRPVLNCENVAVSA